MTKNETFVFDDIVTRFVTKAARYVSRRYSRYHVHFDDVSQEMLTWLYGEGRKRVERWLSSDPQQTTRIYRSLLDEGLGYAEREKAEQVGYSVDDVTWYSPSLVEALLPLVLDETFDGTFAGEKHEGKSAKPPEEGGDMLAMVMDVRRALSLAPEWVGGLVLDSSSGEDERWDEAIQVLVELLGGRRPRVGQRRVISNATAQAITGNDYA